MSVFEFATSRRWIFGRGAMSRLGGELAALGNGPILLVRGASSRERDPALLAQINSAKEKVVNWSAKGEPTVEMVDEATAAARSNGCTRVVACGGGSVLDLGKAVSGMLTHEGSVLDYLEVIGKGRPLNQQAAPMIAIPTTSGTGSEVTRNAVIHSTAHRFKASLRGPGLLPTLAIVDPVLTYSLPAAPTAYGGMDALTQLIEPFLSIKANRFSDLFCREGIPLAARWLPVSFRAAGKAELNSQEQTAREHMSWSAMLSGMALGNSGLGVVHALAAVLGGMYRAPHGALCAALVPAAVRVNFHYLLQTPTNPQAARCQELAQLLTGQSQAQPDEAILFLEKLRHAMEIPPLREWRVHSRDFGTIIEQAMKTNSMKGNPVELRPVDLQKIVELAF